MKKSLYQIDKIMMKHIWRVERAHYKKDNDSYAGFKIEGALLHQRRKARGIMFSTGKLKMQYGVRTYI